MTVRVLAGLPTYSVYAYFLLQCSHSTVKLHCMRPTLHHCHLRTTCVPQTQHSNGDKEKEREKKTKKVKQWASSTQLGAFVACLLAGMAHTGNRSLDLSLAKKGRDCSRKHFEISMKIQRSVSQCGQARTGPTEAAAQSLFSHSVLSLRVLSCRSR